ncbi:MAG: hypothetical protein DCC50_04135 [Acidobacteria bacterium]|nr:MAG: hypothetical protein DCC50_04135 [Acidobacteriota bacterium]
MPGGTDPGADERLRERARELSPGLFHTVTQGRASFDHVAQARRIRQRHPEYGAESRLLEQLAEDRLLEQSGEAIESEYWCTREYAGCALTSGGRLMSVSNTQHRELVLIEAQARQLGRDVESVFARRGLASTRMASATTLYSVLTRVMATADLLKDDAATARQRKEALATLRAEWGWARARTQEAIQRQARFEYFLGVLGGLVAALVVLGLVGWFASGHWPRQINTPAFLAATLSGSVGAVVSVLERMMPRQEERPARRRALVLDYTAPTHQKVVIGAARPFVGGIFAGVLYFAILGGLLTIQGTASQTQNTPATFAFFGLLGFAAGFSERFATDILERVVARSNATGAEPGAGEEDVDDVDTEQPSAQVDDDAQQGQVAEPEVEQPEKKPEGGRAREAREADYAI